MHVAIAGSRYCKDSSHASIRTSTWMAVHMLLCVFLLTRHLLPCRCRPATCRARVCAREKSGRMAGGAM